MITSDILALLLPLILPPRHSETTRGPHTTASCKYFNTPHPYRSEYYNRRMRGKYSRIVTMKIKKKECYTMTSQEVTHPSTNLAQARLTSSYDGIRCFSTGMIVSDILALLLPLILASRHPETTCGARATASCKYLTTPHP